MKILVVCTANICRSPMGERVLARLLAETSARVSSAGTRAINGNVADATVSELIRERGWGDLADHRSQSLLPSVVQRAELVLCMEQEHVRHILAMDPTLQGRVRRFGHWQGSDIADPIGQSRARYAACLDEIEAAANTWKDKLKQMGLIV